MPGYTPLLFRLLRLVLPESIRDGLVGDLEELYPERRAASGRLVAGLWLISQVAMVLARYGPRRAKAMMNGNGGWTVSGFAGWIHDGARQVRRAPGFAAVVTVMVALGVGVNVTAYSLLDGVVLAPMPYPEPDRIVSVSEGNPDIQISPGWTSIPNFVDWQEEATSFESMALLRGRSASVGTDGDPEYAYSAFISSGFFHVFGVQPALGRGFTSEETVQSGDPVVILSHGLWTRGYGADPAILGRTIPVDGNPHTVVGVMPEGFNAPGEWIGAAIQVSLWRPFAMDADLQRGNRSYSAVARLGEGSTLASARAEMEGIHAQLRDGFPEANGAWYAQVFEWSELIVGRARPGLLLLLGTMVMVLLIACANVASLTTTRVFARRQELATRVALGAPRSRIVTQVLSEVAFLVALGGAAGVLAAQFALAGFKAVEPGLIPRMETVTLDGSVLWFALGVTALAALLVGGVAATFATRGDPSGRLRSSRAGPSAAAWRLKGTFTVFQFVLSFALLSSATLLAKSFQNQNRTELGFEAEGLTAMTAALSRERVTTLEARTEFTRDVLSELERSPGVESAAMINSLPLSGSRQITQVAIDGHTEEGREPAMAIRGVSPGYHAMMGIPVIEGRALGNADIDVPSTALLNETAVALHWPDRTPIGERVRVSRSGSWLTVVGVVGDVLHDGPRGEVLPEVYVPYSLETLTSKSFIVRTAGDAAAVPTLLRDALRRVDPAQPVREIRSMHEWVARRMATARFLATLMGAAAALAVILAGVGLFAALASLVRERNREIAIRMALGARKQGVLHLVARKAAVLVGAGLAGGIALSLPLNGVLESFLFGVRPQSVAIVAAVTLGLLLTATLAAYLPAMWAASVDPAKVLKEE
jgi:predicted permease